jgi:hypothetical protein
VTLAIQDSIDIQSAPRGSGSYGASHGTAHAQKHRAYSRDEYSVPFIFASTCTASRSSIERLVDVDHDSGFDATITVSKGIVLVIVFMQFVAAINGRTR